MQHHRTSSSSSRPAAPFLARLLLFAALGTALGCGSSDREPVEPTAPPGGDSNLHSLALGGSGFEAIRDIDIDEEGNLFVAGSTGSPDFPTTPDSPDRSLGDGELRHDAFVTRHDPDGELVWSRYLGGPGYDRAYALELAPDGSVVVAGRAGAGFPVTEGAAQTTFRGGVEADIYGDQDGFVCRLEAETGEVVFCTYFGSSDPGILRDVDLTSENEIVVAGGRSPAPMPPEWPERSGRTEVGGPQDGIVAKLAADGSRVLWTRHLGGDAFDGATPSVRVDEDDSVVVLMFAASQDLPVTPEVFQPSYGGGDGDLMIARLSPDGREIRMLTYVGGSGVEDLETHGLVIAPDGDLVVAAITRSPDFPTTEGALQSEYGGHGGRRTGGRTNYSGDGFVARLSPDARTLRAATFVGGSLGDGVEGVAVDARGVSVSGASYSDDLTGAPGSRGQADFFVLTLSPMLDRVLAGGRYGGRGRDWGRAVAMAPDGVVWAGGVTWRPVAPVDGGHRAEESGRGDAVLLRMR